MALPRVGRTVINQLKLINQSKTHWNEAILINDSNITRNPRREISDMCGDSCYHITSHVRIPNYFRIVVFTEEHLID